MNKFLAFIGGAALLAGLACSEDNGETPAPKGDGSTTSTPDAGAGGPDAATLPTMLPADVVMITGDDPNIQYTGRFDTGQYPMDLVGTPKEPWAALGGSSVTIKFTGTAVGVMLEDQFLYDRRDFFDAIVDGQVVGEITPAKDTTTYPIAVGLPAGDHVVTVVKRTESGHGRTGFKGFAIEGQIIAPPPRPTRRIYFIGDSITAGEGVDAKSPSDPLCATENAQGAVDVYKAFGPVLARDVGAEYQLIGIGGMGLMRNYSNTYEPRHMPDVFDLLYGNLGAPTTPSPVWDPTHKLWIPDAIVIALGTNDFAPGDPMSMPPLEPKPDAVAFGTAYIAFVTTLRGLYPDAEIFGINAPGQSDPGLTGGLTMMESHFKTATPPDLKVHAITTIASVAGTGCTTHPNAAQHVAMAKEIGDVLKPILNW